MSVRSGTLRNAFYLNVPLEIDWQDDPNADDGHDQHKDDHVTLKFQILNRVGSASGQKSTMGRQKNINYIKS